MAWGIQNILDAIKGPQESREKIQPKSGPLYRTEKGGGIDSSYEGMKNAGWAGTDSYAREESKDQDLWDHAKDFAKNFDSESSGDVGELQSLMNQLGITDEEGASFKEDSILGAKTMQGLRQLQGRDDDAYRSGPRMPEGGIGSSPMSWVQKLFGGAKGQTGRTRRKLFSTESSGDYSGVKYKRK